MNMRFELPDFAEIVDYAYAELSKCGTDTAFESMAREIAQDENLDVALIRAIGKGVLTDDCKASRPFILRYLSQARDNAPLRDERRATLAHLFGISKQETIAPSSDEAPQEEIVEKVLALTTTNTANDTLTVTQEHSTATPPETKTSRAKLTDEDKEFIREYVDNGVDEDDKKARRLEMVELFKGSTIGQIASITAWTKMESRRVVIKPGKSDVTDTSDIITTPATTTPQAKSSTRAETVSPKVKEANSSKVKLTDEDKKLIREYVAEGLDNEDKRARRAEMAEKFETGVRQIAAVTAWTKIRAQKATCEKTESSSLSSEEIEFIRDFVLEADAPEEETERCIEMAEMFGIDASQIETLVLKALITDDSQQATSDTKVIPKSLKGGAHVEYDNLEKNKWREKMKEFILEQTTEQERGRMKVLCLPGKCWLEATQVYLELGFKAENIHGIEREKTARDEFEATAEELGCQAHFGDLMRFIQHPDTPVFDLVSLDFLGPFSEGTLEILQRLKPAKRQLLLTNFMGKREVSSQVIMRMAKEFSDTSNWRSTKGVNDDSRLMEEKMKAGEESNAPISETRDFIWRFLSRYFTARHVNPHYHKRLGKIGLSLGTDAAGTVMWAAEAVTPVIAALEAVLKNAGEHEQIVGRIGVYLRGLFVKTLLQEATIKQVELHEYRSGSGAGNTNYISDFIALETPIDQMNSMKHSVRFLFDSIEAIKLDFQENGNLAKGDVTIDIQTDGTIRFILRGRTVASVKIGRVKQDVDIYHDICKQNLWDKIILEELELPKRQKIET